MRNIILFIRRYFTFVTFILLQIICLSLLINYNKSYQSSYVNVANGMTGAVEKKYNDVQYYFALKHTNKILAEDNVKMKQALAVLLKNGDTSTNAIMSRIDSLYKDSSGKITKYLYTVAKVVNNSISQENNFITISKGSEDGIKPNMGVESTGGIVGHVVAVSPHYSVIMSALNHNSKVSAMLKKSYYTGIVEWDGSSPDKLLLHNISKDQKVKMGDSVITSNLSSNYPPGLLIGTVKSIEKDPATSFLTIVLKPGANFRNLQYVYLIDNTLYVEQKKIEAVAQAEQQPKK